MFLVPFKKNPLNIFYQITSFISLFVSFIPEPNESPFLVAFFLPRTSRPASTILFLLFFGTEIIFL